jgi:hypothetical protein
MTHKIKVTVNYYDEALKNEVLQLPSDVLAEFLILVDVIIECGASTGIPQAVILGKDLYRSKLFNRQAYVYYCQSGKKEITVIHVSEKCDKLAGHFLVWLKGRQLEVGSVENFS